MNAPSANPSFESIHQFFAQSDLFDYEVLRPLSHVKGNWELSWDHEHDRYAHEEDSFAKHLNQLIFDLAGTAVPKNYHDDEDVIANHLASQRSYITKENGRWVGAPYAWILEQGGLTFFEQRELLKSAIGRTAAAIKRGQLTYDDMEPGHRRMLGEIITILLFHREAFHSDGWSDL